MTTTTNWKAVMQQALAAGIVAGITIELYLILTAALPSHANVLAIWQWIASAAIGDIAFSSVAFAWLGLLVHFIVSIGWAGGYAYLAQQQTFMNARWAISGIVYGLVVYCFMDLILLGAHKLAAPTPPTVANSIIAHCVFFGLPLAYVVSRYNQSRHSTERAA